MRGEQRGEGRGGRGGGAAVLGERRGRALALGERRGRARWGRGGGSAMQEMGGGGRRRLRVWVVRRPYIRERGKGRWWAVGPILALGTIISWLC
jgi:hypothetical protein